MAEQGFFKNLVNKLPYQTMDFNAVMQDLNPKYSTFQDTGMRRVEALAKNSIFYNNDFNNQGAGQIAVDPDTGLPSTLQKLHTPSLGREETEASSTPWMRHISRWKKRLEERLCGHILHSLRM